MKVLVITGSRADRNGLEMVHEALLKAGHESTFAVYPSQELARASRPDVIVVGGDRYEILRFVVSALDTWPGVPIAHIAGGDVTEGSADDRYRDAITALACIHFTTNEKSEFRVQSLARTTRHTDSVYRTGSPAIDRIKQTPVEDRSTTFGGFFDHEVERVALVCVHPNTVGGNPLADYIAVRSALAQLPDLALVILGANADSYGDQINLRWKDWVGKRPHTAFAPNVSPQSYYSLMTHCDVMVGNSSAMLYEAPCFNLPCLMFGRRQEGRMVPPNVFHWLDKAMPVDNWNRVFRYDRDKPIANPYGDGNSAPRIVKALEENAWRWSK